MNKFLISFLVVGALSAQIRTNVGGPAYSDTSGNLWSADNGCTSDSTYSYSGTITGTSNPTLYQTGRVSTSSLSCVYTVQTNSFYMVTLKFAEYNRNVTTSLPRLMNITINGVRYYTAFNVLAACGFASACDISPNPIPVGSAGDGTVSVVITQQQGAPMLSALSIIPVAGLGGGNVSTSTSLTSGNCIQATGVATIATTGTNCSVAFAVDACATAVCDGTTDDHVAVLAALATIPNTGGMLFFSKPSVSMGSTSLVVGYQHTNLCIASTATTTLKYTGNARAIEFGDNSHFFMRGPCIRGMKIDITGAGNSATAVYVGIHWYGNFVDTFIQGKAASAPTGQTGVYLDGGPTYPTTYSLFDMFTNVNIVGAFSYGYILGSAVGAGQVNSATWSGGSVVGTATSPLGLVGVLINSGDSNAVAGKTDVEGWQTGLKMESSSNGPLQFRMEGNTTDIWGTTNCGINDLGAGGGSTILDQCYIGLVYKSSANGGIIRTRDIVASLGGITAVDNMPACSATTLGDRRLVLDNVSKTPGAAMVHNGQWTVPVVCIKDWLATTYSWQVD